MKHEFDLSEETLQLFFAAKPVKMSEDVFMKQLLAAAGFRSNQPECVGPPDNINEMVRRFESFLDQVPAVAFCHQTRTMNVWEVPVRYRDRRHTKKLFVSTNGSGLVYFPVTDLWSDPRQQDRRDYWAARGMVPPQALKNGRFSGWRAYPRAYIRKNGDGLKTATSFFFQILDV